MKRIRSRVYPILVLLMVSAMIAQPLPSTAQVRFSLSRQREDQ